MIGLRANCFSEHVFRRWMVWICPHIKVVFELTVIHRWSIECTWCWMWPRRPKKTKFMISWFFLVANLSDDIGLIRNWEESRYWMTYRYLTEDSRNKWVDSNSLPCNLKMAGYIRRSKQLRRLWLVTNCMKISLDNQHLKYMIGQEIPPHQRYLSVQTIKHPVQKFFLRLGHRWGMLLLCLEHWIAQIPDLDYQSEIESHASHDVQG